VTREGVIAKTRVERLKNLPPEEGNRVGVAEEEVDAEEDVAGEEEEEYVILHNSNKYRRTFRGNESSHSRKLTCSKDFKTRVYHMYHKVFERESSQDGVCMFLRKVFFEVIFEETGTVKTILESL
jgi:hypothetical protein